MTSPPDKTGSTEAREADGARAAPIRSIIVDDEPAARRGIEQLIERRPDFELVGQCADGESLVEAISELAPDLVFLDVQMPGLDGFDALAAVAPTRVPHVIFVTAYDRYAVRAFEAHAIDFLLKPYSADRFDEACDKARDLIRAREADKYHTRLLTMVQDLTAKLGEAAPDPADEGRERRFVVRSHGSISFVNVEDVLWVSAARDYVRLHTAEGAYLIRETMSSVEERLAPDGFTRVHRSTIVRTDAIRQIKMRPNGRTVVVLPDGTERVVSRSGKRSLEDALGLTL